MLVPPYTEEPEADWYARTFAKATHVYPFTLQLWLTHRELRGRPRIGLPRDVRDLIESVYAPGESDIPAGLEASDINREAQQGTDRTRARHGTLTLAEGYPDTMRDSSDEDVLTRLGLATRTLRLALWDGRSLQPLVTEKEDWRYSQVRVAAYRISRALAPDERAALAQAELNETLPDRNRGVLFVALVPEGNRWKGSGFAEEKPVTIHYDLGLGLRIEEAETMETP